MGVRVKEKDQRQIDDEAEQQCDGDAAAEANADAASEASLRMPTSLGKKRRDGPGSSCHFCRQKRTRLFNCPYQNGGHRWCDICLRAHFGVSVDELQVDARRIWPHGCPRCTKMCDCSACKPKANQRIVPAAPSVVGPTTPAPATALQRSSPVCKRKQQQCELAPRELVAASGDGWSAEPCRDDGNWDTT